MIAQRFQNSASAAEVIKLSVDAMLECIGPDLWEETLLRPMDFGHSFSRTLEADERFQLRHGAPRAYSRPCRIPTECQHIGSSLLPIARRLIRQVRPSPSTV